MLVTKSEGHWSLCHFMWMGNQCRQLFIFLGFVYEHFIYFMSICTLHSHIHLNSQCQVFLGTCFFSTFIEVQFLIDNCPSDLRCGAVVAQLWSSPLKDLNIVCIWTLFSDNQTLRFYVMRLISTIRQLFWDVDFLQIFI